jgi:hypothetical protein
MIKTILFWNQYTSQGAGIARVTLRRTKRNGRQKCRPKYASHNAQEEKLKYLPSGEQAEHSPTPST